MAQLQKYDYLGANATRMIESGSIAILPACDADIRCKMWLGPLNQIGNIGCGINILGFMGEIDWDNAQKGIGEASNGGTPFQHIVNWFNLKSTTIGLNKQYREKKYPIDSMKGLDDFFQDVKSKLPHNSCVLVKLNRNDDATQRPRGLTPGHYILLHKDSEGVLHTYEPIYSRPGDCKTRKFKGVSPNFFNSYQAQGYISASILEVRLGTDDDDIVDDGGGDRDWVDMEIDDNVFGGGHRDWVGPPPAGVFGRGGGNDDDDPPFKFIDTKLVELFTKQLHTCEKPRRGGKRKTNKRKTNKRKTNKRKTNKRKTNKRN